mgnify:CR=1 FL=1|tara:strand:+ start:1257 stop:2384 length:1128 start_codon:yes stop_codon:yes gene_type:complete
MFFLVLFFIKILKNPKTILVIIQRSNGDVFLSSNLIQTLFNFYNEPQIDLLVNEDTLNIAKLIPNIRSIHEFSYSKKKQSRWTQEKNLISNIFRKYDLSINLTASDRSVLYSLLSGKVSISAVEKKYLNSWWKKLFLNKFYYFDLNNHILYNNSGPLRCLNIIHQNVQNPPLVSQTVVLKIKKILSSKGIHDFIIFHPSAQYKYKIYPKALRKKLLMRLNSLGISIVVTGGSSEIDLEIKNEIYEAENIYNFIGKTSLEELFALTKLSEAYIGMDTLNMHIAASFNKRIFAIFGPTNICMWSPWSNNLQRATKENKPVQNYDNFTIFQSSHPCQVCGLIGCGSNHGLNELPYSVKPDEVFIEVAKWYKSYNLSSQ